MNALLMTAAGRRILVPRAIVAEVVSAVALTIEADAGSGLEAFAWRGRRVPLLRADALGGEATQDATTIAVFHGLRQQRTLPYYGVQIVPGPRLFRLVEEDLQEIGDVQLHPAELMRVRIDGEEASIPKVDQLESAMLALLEPVAG